MPCTKVEEALRNALFVYTVHIINLLYSSSIEVEAIRRTTHQLYNLHLVMVYLSL